MPHLVMCRSLGVDKPPGVMFQAQTSAPFCQSKSRVLCDHASLTLCCGPSGKTPLHSSAVQGGNVEHLYSGGAKERLCNLFNWQRGDPGSSMRGSVGN